MLVELRGHPIAGLAPGSDERMRVSRGQGRELVVVDDRAIGGHRARLSRTAFEMAFEKLIKIRVHDASPSGPFSRVSRHGYDWDAAFAG